MPMETVHAPALTWCWMFSEILAWNVHLASRNSGRSLDSKPVLLPTRHPSSDICRARFWLRAIEVASEPAQQRFIQSFSAYVYAVIDEASDRTKGHIRGIADFLELRRLTAGAYASFFSVELGLDIPHEIMAHPAVESLRSLAADSTVLTNVRTSTLV